MVYTKNENGWRIQVTKTNEGCVYEYQQKITLTGVAQNIDLDVGFPFELNKIVYYSNDTTAKSFDERIYSGEIDPTSYDMIVNVTANVDQALAYYPSGSEGVHTQAPIRIRTAVSASTAAKTLTKKVVIRRL